MTVMHSSNYTITIHSPEAGNQLWGARCEELKITGFGESANAAFYNLIENIPVYFEVKDEISRQKKLRGASKNTKPFAPRTFQIPAYA